MCLATANLPASLTVNSLFPRVREEREKVPTAPQDPWRPFDTLRRQVDRLFDEFDRPWHLPFSRHGLETAPLWQGGPSRMPAVDVVEKENSFEITAECLASMKRMSR